LRRDIFIKNPKKMRWISFLIILGVVMVSSAPAQETSVEKIEQFASQYGRSASFKYEELKGSPYLDEAFESGEIKLRNGETVELDLRLNIYDDELEFETAQGIRVFTVPEKMSRIILGRSEYVFFGSSDLTQESSGFFKVIAGEECLLLLKHRITYIPSVGAGAYEPATEAELRKEPDTYYLAISGEIPVKLKRKKKFILELIPSHEEEISRYMKEKKISLYKTNDLIELVDFINVTN